jgi:hypothetical protein
VLGRVNAETAADLGFTVLLSHTMEDAHVERAWIERELPTAEGIVLASSRMSDSAIRTLAKQKPVVVLNRRLNGAMPTGEPLLLPVKLVVCRSTAQRSRNRTSPALGTTKVSSSASAAARSMDSTST